MGKNRELITRILDYANCADASYAMLHYVYENIDSANPNKEWLADNITRYDKIQSDIKDEKGEVLHKAGNNTAYARAIEARFCQDLKIYSPNDNKYIEINNDP
ncbi:hypothetical protein CQA53_11370, partial [Helicobacter didelphidarum]